MTDADANEMIAGPGGELRLGSTVYKLRSPDDRDFAELRIDIRKQMDPLESLDGEWLARQPAAVRQEIIAAAIKARAEAPPELTREIIAAQIATPRVIASLIWRLLERPIHAGIKRSEIEAAITDRNLLEVAKDLFTTLGLDKLGKADGMTSSGSGAPSTGHPTTAS